MNARDKRDGRAEDDADIGKTPELSEADWDDIGARGMKPSDAPANGDLRFTYEPSGELPEEDDDNDYQESDEALPDDEEERAIARNPGREGGRFDEV